MYSFREHFCDVLYVYPFLLQRIAVADRDRVSLSLRGIFAERSEVDRDAEGRADLVLAAVALADTPGDVEIDGEIGFLNNFIVQFFGLRNEVFLFRERKNG